MTNYISLPSFLWKVENFFSADKQVSPAIFLRGLQWQCTFSHFVEVGTEKIQLILECLSDCEKLSSWEFKVSCCFVYDDGSHSDDANVTGIYNLEHKSWCIWSSTISDFVRNFRKTGNDATFFVKVIPHVRIESLFKKQENKVNNQLSCVERLSDDFGELFNKDEYSDFVLNCGEKSFHVHKCVLSARSDFFAAMFRSNMKEADEGIGLIEGIEPDILESVLRYLYTGKIPELSAKSLKKVYHAAERFAVESLKVECHSLFVDNVMTDSEKDNNDTETNSENIDGQNEDTQVQSQTGKEKQIFKELFMTREWGSLSQAFPHKALEICECFLQK